MSVMRTTLLLATALAFMLPSMVFGQDVIGTAVLGGKRVDLLSDGTWKYTVTNKPSSCVPVHKNVDFCGSILDWQPTKKTGTDFSALFRYDDRHYGGLIIEEVGRADGYNHEFMRTAVLTGAADGSGVLVEQIPVHDVSETTLDDKVAETLIYGARIDGVGFVFANTIFIGEQITIQAMVWAINTEFSEEHQAINQNFIKAVKITNEEPAH